MKEQHGFSTVELLVTLFVATAFLLTGYQLYSMIISDSGETKAQAKANNYAYTLLQQYKATEKATLASANCAQSLNNAVSPAPTIAGLSNVSATVDITCPNSDVTTVAKVQITLKYGNTTPRQEVIQATYVNK